MLTPIDNLRKRLLPPGGLNWYDVPGCKKAVKREFLFALAASRESGLTTFRIDRTIFGRHLLAEVDAEGVHLAVGALEVKGICSGGRDST